MKKMIDTKHCERPCTTTWIMYSGVSSLGHNVLARFRETGEHDLAVVDSNRRLHCSECNENDESCNGVEEDNE